MNWLNYYKTNKISAEEAVSSINSGDAVTITVSPHPTLLMDALAKRGGELQNVQLNLLGPHHDPGWLQIGWQKTFPITVMFYLGDVVRPAHDQKLVDFMPMIFSSSMKPFEEVGRNHRAIDYFFAVVSPPDSNGFCSFGSELWDKRRLAQVANKVIVEVDESQIRTYGTNYIHVSQIDCFVDHTPDVLSLEAGSQLIASVQDPEVKGELTRISPFMSDSQRAEALPALIGANISQVKGWGRWSGWIEPSDQIKQIAASVADLVKDGDNVQIGVGTPGVYLPSLGIFDERKDLGWHAEMAAPGILSLVEKGVVNGSRKSVHKGKAIFTGLMGSTPDEVAYANENPLVELRDADSVLNITNIAANDNQVAINNAISIDLSGQINSETLFGGRLYNGAGGQPELHIGAVLSKGGRGITLLTSTAMEGAVSKIVPQQEEGSVVTIPRTFADIVVTEYGVARLLGKSVRERAQELIKIAHPDFRSSLQKSAEELYYP